MKSSQINNRVISNLRVSVIYFAQVRELTGIGEEVVILEKESKLMNLISKIEGNHQVCSRSKKISSLL